MLQLGIDVGGTHIAAGLVGSDGALLSRAEAPTGVGRPFEEIVRDMAACALRALEQAGREPGEVSAVGVGIPGVAENRQGTVYFCTNLHWTDVPLRAELQKHLPLPVYIENDATLAGYAESVAGISRGVSSSVFLTLGTGVGAGIVLGGRPWTGAHGVASELGHLTLRINGVPCTCGKRGCVERYCSATALIRMAREALELPAARALWERCGGDPGQISAKTVIDLAREGDRLCLRLFRRYCGYLALLVNNVISFLDPEVIVLGGGVSRAGEFLLGEVRRRLPELLMFRALPYSRVELACLGNEAGIIGAALYAKIMTEEGEQSP